jgi:hypothetical protein
MRERCPECGRKSKKGRRYADEPFGASSTVDELAFAIYREFHSDDTEDVVPWDLFSKQDHDIVVTAFRWAAYAARRAIDEAGVGGVYDDERDW